VNLPTPWDRLRALTAARIGLPQTGAAIATPALLQFRMAHAQARDAVAAVLDTTALAASLAPTAQPLVCGSSAAAERKAYLMRPDLGRQLDPAFDDRLREMAGDFDLVVVVSDGLSADAAQQHAAPVVLALLGQLPAWKLAPLVILRHGRVAAGDRVALALGARSVLVLLGERPGLSSPDSLGAYLTWMPRLNTPDSARNCVSNIRPLGLAPDLAAQQIANLLTRMRTAGGSGVALKADDTLGLA
jgi:ethanolamine ammonia-lyase small subunit